MFIVRSADYTIHKYFVAFAFFLLRLSLEIFYNEMHANENQSAI